MEINHFILVLISLSCLFSFSVSTNSPSPLPNAASPSASALLDIFENLSGSPASAPFSFDGQSFNVPELAVEKLDELLSILPGSIDAALQQICGNTDHPIECLITTIPFLDEKVAVEPISILKAGIQAMDNKTKEALAEATKLLQDPSTPKQVASCLETCIESYNAILDSDQKSLEAISLRNLFQLSTELGANVENVLGCDDAFRLAQVESPMKEMDSLLAKIISNTLTIGVELVHF